MTRSHLWLEPSGWRLRVIDGDPKDRPPYRVFVTIAAHGDVAIVDGLHGKIRHGEVVEFYRKVRALGYRWLLAERTGKHRLPYSRVVDRPGAFCGWREVDLTGFDRIEEEGMA